VCFISVIIATPAHCHDKNTITSSAVPLISNHTVYDVQYSYRLLSKIATVSMSIYLFTV